MILSFILSSHKLVNKLLVLFFLLLITLTNIATTAQTTPPVKPPTTPLTTTPKTSAEAGASVSIEEPAGCKGARQRQDVKIWDLIDLAGSLKKFLPLIPAECALNNGQIQPLGIKVIPDIIIRAVGLLFVMAFYLMPGAVILLGFYLGTSPFNPAVNMSQFTEITTLPRLITKQIGAIFIGLALVLFAYTIVFTILRIIGFEGEYTDLDKFFG